MKDFVADIEDLLPTVNDSPYERILAIGDVHGDFNRLMNLWSQLNVTDNDLVIFLGDYIDRGAQVLETLQWIFHNKRDNVIFLRGNHEQIMINALKDRAWLWDWLAAGGSQTLKALDKLNEIDPNERKEIIDFVKQLPMSYRIKIGGRDYFFCHAGIDISKTLDEQTEDALLWIREECFDYYEGDAVITIGHTPIWCYFPEADLKPFRVPNRNIIMTDTGSYRPDSCISAVDVLSGEYFKSEVDLNENNFCMLGE